MQATGEGIQIDFQQQYDLAGIPDTDEVEQLENFLARLDPSLPSVSKLAAAQAFLGAIGKDKEAVLGVITSYSIHYTKLYDGAVLAGCATARAFA